ncbi:MAG: DNA photolyase family protein [Methylacidiphilales bacterium]|nr:DNA photolyase family protein [Candidatus Methylacidiphilales bacterium]MDW8349165.1 deoxyribodipyrimidine photo-lyase [Verrucomicrobiae bacterium]
MSTAIHWFRADLRLTDNTALYHAARNHRTLYPLFVLDPSILLSPTNGAPITAFFFAALESLRHDLARHGIPLTLRYGLPRDVIPAFIRETRAQALYFNKDVEPAAIARDQEITRIAQSLGLQVHAFEDNSILPPTAVLKPDGSPYTVFTPYSKNWLSNKIPPPLPQPTFQAPTPPPRPPSDPIPSLSSLNLTLKISIPPATETAAHERLTHFISGPLLHYRSHRNFPAIDGTSRLSPYIRAGLISTRTIYHAAQAALQKHPQAADEIHTFIKELIWRDFYRQILYHFPHAATSAFRPEYNDIPWENNPDLFQAWCQGRTGFPLVDAAMRQLNTTGWMHNRLRMVVAMFLTKDLHISWQWGERYFMQHLLDADLACNNGGWQWSASTGTDAAPYFRIFNPNSQAAKFDPHGAFIAQYVPEHNDLTYQPIVDHNTRRLRTLALYKLTPRH